MTAVQQRAVLFDLDGTLVDSRAALLASWYGATERVIGRVFPETDQDHAWVFHTRGAEIFAAITRNSAEADLLSATFDIIYATQQVAAFAGVHPALARLSGLGISVGLVSSKACSRMSRDLAASRLADRFAVVVSGDDVTHPKPHPEGIERALSALGVAPIDAVMVGDTAADLDAGAAAGVRTVYAGWGYGAEELGHLAGAAAASPDDLVDVVLDLLAATPERRPRRKGRPPLSNLSFDFTGRTVVVTGAGRGIGLEIARSFATWGADAYVADRDGDVLDGAAATSGARPLQVDVTSTDQVNAAIDRVVGETGRVDVLVNNAGILRDKVLWKLDDEDWEQVLATHAGGTFKFTRAAVPHMRAASWGRVINVTSYTGLHGNTGQANYATAKAGIIGFTRTAAKELARFGITVNAISPNAVTRMVESIPPEKLDELVGAIPAGRFAEPAEMAPAVGFLASEQAGYITGVVLPVDGGLSI